MALNSGLAKEADIDDLPTLKKKLTDIINTLTEREREILKQRFGLKGNARTLDEVSRRFQVIRECICQIEVKALRKMRQPTRIRKLEELVNLPNSRSSDGGDECAEDKKYGEYCRSLGKIPVEGKQTPQSRQ